jgi:dihydrofolate reductase
MKYPSINIIAAVGRNLEIGKNGDLIWRISADLKRFKKITMGGTLIMGRKTYESIGKPLPGRVNIVITRRQDYSGNGIWVFHSPSEALEKARCFQKDIFIIGGEQIYKHYISKADKLLITHIDAIDPQADAFFPKIDPGMWMEKYRSRIFQDSETLTSYYFAEYLKQR